MVWSFGRPIGVLFSHSVMFLSSFLRKCCPISCRLSHLSSRYSRYAIRFILGILVEKHLISRIRCWCICKSFFPLQMSFSQSNHANHCDGVLCYSDISVVVLRELCSSTRKSPSIPAPYVYSFTCAINLATILERIPKCHSLVATPPWGYCMTYSRSCSLWILCVPKSNLYLMTISMLLQSMIMVSRTSRRTLEAEC